MNIERIRKEHLCEVAGLERICFPEPWSEASLELLLSEQATGYVALEAGRVVSYAGMLYAVDEGQITNVAVLPDARRKGYGRAVVSAVIKDAAEHGLEQISLEVREGNLPAIRLYECLGFVEAGRRRHFYRNPQEDALVMIRKITKEE